MCSSDVNILAVVRNGRSRATADVLVININQGLACMARCEAHIEEFSLFFFFFFRVFLCIAVHQRGSTDAEI